MFVVGFLFGGFGLGFFLNGDVLRAGWRISHLCLKNRKIFGLATSANTLTVKIPSRRI